MIFFAGCLWGFVVYMYCFGKCFFNAEKFKTVFAECAEVLNFQCGPKLSRKTFIFQGEMSVFISKKVLKMSKRLKEAMDF